MLGRALARIVTVIVLAAALRRLAFNDFAIDVAGVVVAGQSDRDQDDAQHQHQAETAGQTGANFQIFHFFIFWLNGIALSRPAQIGAAMCNLI